MAELPDFGELADLYERHRTGYSDELYEHVLAAAPEQPAVLDLAAGTGLSTRPLGPHARRLVAVDVAVRMLARASEVDRVLAQAEKLPFAPAGFELVTCAQAFHWLDPTPTYRELHRVLAPQGVAAIWWKYPAAGDEVRRITDEAIEAVVGRKPPHTPLVEGPLPDQENTPFAIETTDLPFTMAYTLEGWLGYQASRRILRNEAADGDEHERVLAEIEERLRETVGQQLEVGYVQHLHLMTPG